MRPHKEGFRIELVGEIAQMVAFGNHYDAKKKAASINEATCSVKVVARAGLKPAPANTTGYAALLPPLPSRAASAASRNASMSPSSTALVFPVSTSVRRSFTI